ncbi:cation/H+ exchanger [Peniophora sp. CONT]|nr:cation/H+ exchanger [Peniophora sp. CONT]
MGEFSSEILNLGRSVYARAASEQSGIFAGLNPATVNPQDPFVLWVIQSIVIIGMTQFLAFFLGRIRQPRVISEIIGGVILGPSIMGRIPGFSNAIFPATSIPYLTLTSTVGLVFFLFLVGLELDVRLIKRNYKASSTISFAGLAIPLGLGAALAVPLYDQFIKPEAPDTNRGYFILFVAVAVGITAFPVLCRILSEIRLLDTTVGVVTLAAGVGNDVVGWVLLALAVALVNASTGLNALYVLLVGLGFVLFLIFPVKWGYAYVARRWGGLDRGEPTTLMMTSTLIMVIFSAFFTDIIGIHPIFGGFLAGLVIPKTNGFDIALVEKLEDFISLLFLPQYFMLSGLKTNLGLLDNGITWGYIFLICTVAFFSKFISCFCSAKVWGFTLRESSAIGSLMACKGLVELIVLNVGLQAGILNTRTFSMFVLHAIILTFITTPLVLFFYPEHIRDHASKGIEAGAVDGIAELPAGSSDSDEFKSKFSMILDRAEDLPAAMTLAQLFKTGFIASTGASGDRSSIAKDSEVDDGSIPSALSPTQVSLEVLRLIELSERMSALTRAQTVDVLVRQDSVLNVLRTYGQLNHLNVNASLAIVPEEEYPTNISQHARNVGSQMVLIPWALPGDDGANLSESAVSSAAPFHGMFRQNSAANGAHAAAISHVFRRVFASATSDIALFVDRGISAPVDGSPHLLLPFFGGPDDRLALSLVVQMCLNPSVTATVIRMNKLDSETDVNSQTAEKQELSYGNTVAFPDTVYGSHNTQTRLQSDTADNIAWSKYTTAGPRTHQLASAVNRISFLEESSAAPLHRLLELTAQQSSTKPPVVIVGRSRRMATETHKQELLKLAQEHNAQVSSELPKTIGEVGAALVATGANVSLMVVQAVSTSA